jgi:hypothetical protein
LRASLFFVPLVLGGLALVVAGCPTPSDEQPCSYADGDCPDGLVCIVDNPLVGEGFCRGVPDAGPEEEAEPDAGPVELPCAEDCPVFWFADGQPHVQADTCSNDGACVCAASAVGACAAPIRDCTSGGCFDVYTDSANCGDVGNDCTDPALGAGAFATCRAGGSCVLEEGIGRCVCDDFTVDGVPRACPMAGTCTEGGCVFDTVVGTYPTMASVRAVIGL